jgi:hypothetical protein
MISSLFDVYNQELHLPYELKVSICDKTSGHENFAKSTELEQNEDHTYLWLL